MKRRPMTNLRRRRLYGTLFILPWIIGFLVFFLRPILYSLYYSFSEVTFGPDGLEVNFVGLAQYADLLTKNTEYLPALFEAVRDLCTDVPLILAFSLMMGILLNQKFFGRTLARAVFFLPVIIASGVVITMLKEDVFASNMLQGNVNDATLFNASGLATMLTNMDVPSVIVDMLTGVIDKVFDLVWQSGIQILLFLSALQAIPKSYYEAAHMEGANGWVAFWKITFPSLLPMLMVAIVYSVIDSFTFYANPMMELISQTQKGSPRYSYAIAMSWGYFLVVMLVLGLVFLVLGRKMKYGDRQE